MKVCPKCGRENADDARFCSSCGTPLVPDTPVREERKVVTFLFCDLVGFTARAERMDPEDVRRLLQPFHARLRSELERFGGTVEKFIGDAVMAVFGAPLAHEDDPERAVRAALAIRDALAEEGELEIRIGITTGEALITLDARPEAGEGMASGDIVNTAARVQAIAPAGAILVDSTTFRATERVIEYDDPAQIEAKGKERPVDVWPAVRARARVGVERLSGTPLVGRGQELTLLRETLARVSRERQPQLVTLVGVPGIGKSRLVYELFRSMEAGDFGLVLWRHGRSLPYGDGVTFWALAEMVKSQAGILESDGPAQAAEKLHGAVGSFIPDSAEAGWVERQLRPLAGLEVDDAWSGDAAGQAFAAWRRFLEALAETHPLVLVFEDLQWADDALLDFVDHLVDRARGVPLLALCTARPELLTRRSGWGGGKVNSSTILLSPLSEGETTELVRSLADDSSIGAELEALLLERASGNPLYAEEFSRLLAATPDRAILPESVQGIIAARLDTLPREEKELLQDAAVVGRVFWLGALGRDRWTIEEKLHSLERNEFVSRERRSSVAGEVEYAFRHVLVRDVAYEQIPKAERAEKHRAAAEWIESLGRNEDHAETIAHHHSAAFDYAESAGGDVGRYAERAGSALAEAGERAFGLNAFARAAGFYERGLALLAADDASRPRLLFGLGRSLWIAEARGDDVLLAARDAMLEAGDGEGAAEAETLLVEVFWNRGQRERAAPHLEAAGALARELTPSPAKASTLIAVARGLGRAGDAAAALRIGREALRLAEVLELDEMRAIALNVIGWNQVELGDEEAGLAKIEAGIELALSIGSPEAIRGYANLSHQLRHRGQFLRSMELVEEALRLTERLGIAPQRRFLSAILPQMRYRQGRWDEALEIAEGFLEEVRTSHVQAWHPLGTRALIRLARADESGLDDALTSIEVARRSVDPGVLCAALGVHARSLVLIGRDTEAQDALEEAFAIVDSGVYRPGFDLPYKVVAAFELGYEGERVLAHARPSTWAEAAVAYFATEFARAADIYEEVGSLVDEAEARLRAAKALLAAGEHDEADIQLQRALTFYRGVGATRFVSEGEALLAAYR